MRPADIPRADRMAEFAAKSGQSEVVGLPTEAARFDRLATVCGGSWASLGRCPPTYRRTTSHFGRCFLFEADNGLGYQSMACDLGPRL